MKRALVFLCAESVGLVSVCAGVFMLNVPAGFIASGLALITMVEVNA